jgi:hypothetical protein
VAVSVIALASITGCAGGPSASQPIGDGAPSSSAPTTQAPATQAPAGGGDATCEAWSGKPGVVRVFCTGPATAKLTVDGKEAALSGGECEALGTTVAFNLGVVTSDLPAGTTKPNYLGIIIDTSGKAATSVAYTVGGTADVVLKAKTSLAADGKSGTLTGDSMTTNAKVSITYNCG